LAYTFEVFADKSGGTRFRFRASNNEVMAASESYKAKESALSAIKSIQQHAPGAGDATPYRFEIYEDKAGETRFRFKAPNGEIMLGSEGYKQKASAVSAIESIKKNVPGAAVVDA
jgi:uncharacterized protein YegP (UPF0339 family)